MTTPEFFQRGPSPLVRLVFFSALSVALMVLDARYRAADALRSALSLLVYPAEQAVLAPVRVAREAGQFFTTQRRLQTENDDLRQRLVVAEVHAQRSQSLDQELAELRRSAQLPERGKGGLVLAEVLHGGRNPYVAKLVLDRGLGAGLRPGQPVIDADGVVGQVTSSTPLAAEVTLVTEQNQQVPVRVLRNGLRTLAGGDGVTGTISLPFLPGGADIQTGDVLVTSGIDGVYPEGVPVATVSRIERSANRVFAHVTCTPVAGVARDRYVLVLTAPPPTPVANAQGQTAAGAAGAPAGPPPASGAAR
ncbi:MAG: rod shape-determining protein MreC [Pseudomonadota bacterium]|nr:rod shape-determining protein MreC [Pseudomonadota bacterium]